jgi:hypothetical protein
MKTSPLDGPPDPLQQLGLARHVLLDANSEVQRLMRELHRHGELPDFPLQPLGDGAAKITDQACRFANELREWTRRFLAAHRERRR